MEESLKYQIALTLIPGIGDVLAKNLIDHCGSAEGVFKEKKGTLQKIRGIGEILADAVSRYQVLDRAEEEVTFIQRFKITPLFYLEDTYPQRLRQCHDSPVMLYYKGTGDLNAKRILSIVGTRNASSLGKKLCQDLIQDLREYGVLIVSGLAYGIDICAHKAALAEELPTVGVLAHGLDKIYPALHRSTAEKMLEQGGLLTDFPSKTIPDAPNFPKRNRIVAGLSDATVVVESKAKGGSLITADIANSYSRDVFAFPGRVKDECSLGCNQLIKYNKGALIESGEDIIRMMGWEKPKNKPKVVQQKSLFQNLSPEEEVIINLLKEKTDRGLDELCFLAKLSMSKVSLSLLNLELTGLIQEKPGKIYSLN